jgi:hypothetical protein
MDNYDLMAALLEPISDLVVDSISPDGMRRYSRQDKGDVHSKDPWDLMTPVR